MSWASELKAGLRRAREHGGEGPFLDMIDDTLTILDTHGVTGHADLLERLDRRGECWPWGRRKEDAKTGTKT